MIVIGLTGGIASGKTLIKNYLKKRGLPTHDSDSVIKNLYKNTPREFQEYLKKIGLKKALKFNKINKKTITKEILKKKTTLRKLEAYTHKKVQSSRDAFIQKNKKNKKKIIILDIPLLFENKLEKICDYIFVAISPTETRIARALKRKKMTLQNIKKIIKLQTPDKIKIEKADFVINTTKEKKYTFKQVLKAIKIIKKEHKL